MAQLSKANTITKYNDSGSGLFKDQTSKEIGADDSRALVLDTTESVPYTLDDSYTWAFPKADTSGTDTYTATLVPHINAYANGMKVHVKVKTASTGASTINFNTVGTRKIYINPTTQAGNGDLVDEQEYIMSYDSALDGGNGGWLILGGTDSGGASAAEDVSFTPAGNIAATDVQAAIEELDTEKQAVLVSATNIKTVNGTSILGSGDIDLIDDAIVNGEAKAPSQNAVFDALALKADLASPTFTGNPAAPTPSAGDNDTSIATTAFVQTEVVGIQDFPVSAAAMWPRVTNGCQFLQQTEVATSLFNVQSLDFDATTQEFAQFQVVLPRKWNNGTVTAVFYWTAASGSGTVQWGISGGAYSNDDALSTAFGTAQTVDDTLITANDVHVTSATSAITLAGSPADGDFLGFQISRNPASDTLAVDAKLLAVVIFITTDAAKDA